MTFNVVSINEILLKRRAYVKMYLLILVNGTFRHFKVCCNNSSIWPNITLHSDYVTLKVRLRSFRVKVGNN